MSLAGKEYVLFRGRRGGVTSPKDLKSDSFQTSEDLASKDGSAGEKEASITHKSTGFGSSSKQLNTPLKPPGNVILHYSTFKSAWDWLILILVLYVAVLTPYMAAFRMGETSSVNAVNAVNSVNGTSGATTVQWSTWRFLRNLFEDKFLLIDLVVDFLFFLDMLANFRTTYLNNGELIVSRTKIAVNYLKGWFFVDFISAIPLDVIITIAKQSDTVTATSLMKTARLLRLFRVARKMDYYSEYGASLMVLLMAFITLLAHWLACGFYYLAETERPQLEQPIGWLDSLANLTGKPYDPNNSSSGPDIESKYITSLYFTFTILTSVGFGNIAPVTDLEKSFAIGAMVIGSLANAAIFGNVATIMHRLYRGNKEYHDKSSSIKDFIKFHRIPKKLARRLHESNQEAWWQTNGVDMNKVLVTFPEGMQADICLHLNKPLLTKCPVFQNASPGCLRMLSLKFKLVHVPPGENVINQNDLINSIYFVARGTLEISRDNIVAAILTKADTFGESAKDMKSKSNSSTYLGYRSKYTVRTLSYGDLHKMSLPDLVTVFEVYPEFASEFYKKFTVTFDINNLLESFKEENKEKQRKHSKGETEKKESAVSNYQNLPQTPLSSSPQVSTSSVAQSLAWDNSDIIQAIDRKCRSERFKEIERKVNVLQKQLIQFECSVQKKMSSIIMSLVDD